MVERTKAELTTFVGTVIAVNKVHGNYGEEFDIQIKPEEIEVKGPTGCFHEFLRMSKNATEESVPEGCIMDLYLRDLEMVIPEVEKAKTVSEALNMMMTKKFTFRKKVLGKAFKGHDASKHWVPISLA